MKNPFKSKKHEYDTYDDEYDNDFYRGEEDEEDGLIDELEGEDVPPPAPKKRPMQSSATGNMLKVVKPHNYDDGPAIAGYLMEGYTVVMNIEELERPAAMRLIDFLLGAISVLDGDFRRVTNTTLVFSPRVGEVTGEDARDGE